MNTKDSLATRAAEGKHSYETEASVDQLEQLLRMMGEVAGSDFDSPQVGHATCPLLPPFPVDQQVLDGDWPKRLVTEWVSHFQSMGVSAEVQLIALTTSFRARRFHAASGRAHSPDVRSRAIRESRWIGLASDSARAKQPLVVGFQSHWEEEGEGDPSLALKAGVAFRPTTSHRLIQEVQVDENLKAILSYPVELPKQAGFVVFQIAFHDEVQKIEPSIFHLLSKTILQSVAHSYQLWDLLQIGRRWNELRSLGNRLLDKKWQVGGIALATAMLIAIIPVPYRPSRECVLQATNRHFVASPIEGRLIEAEVRPGDEVKAGQILARMEDLQLQRELAGAESALESASKKRDIALASEMTSDLRLAQLEFQQMRIKVEALKDRLQEMTIVCPADGIVLQGDWQGNNGRPVSFGQTLFEIGSLDDMAAEIQLLSDDLPWVQVGSGALLKPEGSDMQSWRGKVARNRTAGHDPGRASGLSG